MSLEMAHKVIVPPKKIMSRSFLNSGTLIVKFTQGRGELTREKVRGALVHKAGLKYQHDGLRLQSINSSKH
jgi:hypothetical protein